VDAKAFFLGRGGGLVRRGRFLGEMREEDVEVGLCLREDVARAVGGVGEVAGDGVADLEGAVDDGGGDLDAAFACCVEDVFDVVEELGELGKPTGGAGALECVHGPEDAVDGVGVGGGGFKIEQGGFQLGEEVGGLLAEDLAGAALDVVEVDHTRTGSPMGQTFLTTAMNRAGSKGLMIQPVAPAFFPATFLSS